MDIQTILADASEKIGGDVRLEGLMSKIGRLKPCASTAADVLGFDYIVRMDQTCYKYYAANPPLIGMTQPEPIICPLGIQAFNEFKINYKDAVDIFHKGDWGSEFTQISLSMPLVPNVDEPYWHMRSNLGQTVVIGANSGEIVYPTN